MTGFFPTPREAQEAARKRLLANPQLPIFRKNVQAAMDKARGGAFTVDTAGFDSDVVSLVCEELRRQLWVVTPDQSAKNEPFIRARPAMVRDPREM